MQRNGQDAPAHPRIWELSRFAVESEQCKSFGFSSVTMESITAIISYGHHAGIDEYVTVTTTAIERMLNRAGVLTRRIGAPMQIGIEKAVALYVDVAGTYASLCEQAIAC